MLNNKKLWAAGILSLALCGPVGAATLEDAAAAIRDENYQRAARILIEVANTGNMEGQFLLAMMYEHGRGLNKNPKEAAKWYRKAADQGHVAAQNNLGQMYKQGEGVKQDLGEAFKWFRRAAEAGSPIAQYNLGLRYMKGEGVTQNQAEGVKWYQRSADAGNLHAQISLAYSYASGEGVEKNLPDAYAWAKAASTKKFLRAQQLVGFLSSKMTPEELETGEQRFQLLKTRMNLPDAPPPAGPVAPGETNAVIEQAESASGEAPAAAD